MATANEVAMLSLSFIWWRVALGQLGREFLQGLRDELRRNAAYLIRAWEPESGDVGRIMLGVGDQLNRTGVLEMFTDFGSASDALQVQPNPSTPPCAHRTTCAGCPLLNVC